jgi:aromatic-L-amino-acid/L-tryptophan decarboxylase
MQLITQALSITTFRYVPEDLQAQAESEAVRPYLNLLNEELVGALQRGGDLFVSNAVIRTRYALRACIVNFHTAERDVELVPVLAAREGRVLDARLRPPDLRRTR